MTREPKSLTAAERVICGKPPDFDGTAAASTVEAVKFELRTYGISQLRRPRTQARLADLSSDQMADVIAALRRMQPEYPQITDALVQLLQQVPK